MKMEIEIDRERQSVRQCINSESSREIARDIERQRETERDRERQREATKDSKRQQETSESEWETVGEWKKRRIHKREN